MPKASKPVRLRPRDVADLARAYELSDQARMMLNFVRRAAARDEMVAIPEGSPKALAAAREVADAGLVELLYLEVGRGVCAYFIRIDSRHLAELARATRAVELVASETGGAS